MVEGKTPVAKYPEFVIYYENYQGSTFTHADVAVWNKEVKQKFINTHKKLYEAHGQPFYALVDNPKLTKFVYLLGYKPYQTVTCIDGIKRHVWIYNEE